MNLKSFIRWVQVVLLQFKSQVPSITVLILFYILFWNFPQTSDLQLILNQNGRHWIQVPLFFSSLILIAFLIANANDFLRNFSVKDWRLSLIAMDKKEESLNKEFENKNFDAIYEESSKQYVIRMFPKVLGTLLIVIVAFSVENAYFNIKEETILVSAKWGLGITILFLIISLNQYISNMFGKFMTKWSIRHILPPTLALIGFLMLVFYGLRSQGGSEEDIKRLFKSLIILSIVYYIVTTSYSRYILKFKNHFGSISIISMALTSLIMYITLVFYPNILTDKINPLTIINICIIGLFSIANLVKLVGVKWKVPLLSISLIIITIWGFITANRENFFHYDLSAVKVKNTRVSERNSLDKHFKSWISERKQLIEKHSDSSKFKAIFVSSEGGGSRAGLWSFLVHSYLYERNTDYFDKHLVSMTGASGGSVGNVMFYNIANHNLYNEQQAISLKNNNSKPFTYKASRVYQGDFLSTSIAALLGRDLIQSILGIWDFEDRGALLENEWEKSYDSIFEKAPSLKKEFLSMPISKGKKTAPLLIVNTVNVQKGEYAVISPVTFSENSRTMGVFDDFLKDFDCARPNEAIKKSSAMSITARFPYLSPVGRVEKVGQFMDAGYYDNIGGTVTRRLSQVFNEVLEREYDTIFRDKIELVFLIIANGEENKFPEDCELIKSKDFNYAPQLIAPLIGVLNATFAQEKEMKKTLGKRYIIESKRQEVPVDKYQEERMASFADSTKSISPILPLGRYLSNPVIRSMENNLNGTLKAKLDSLVIEK